MSTNYFINQSIIIHYLRVDGISNSSVLQIGSAGIIKPVSNLYNTGCFTGPAPEAKKPNQVTQQQQQQQFGTPLVPLVAPTATSA